MINNARWTLVLAFVTLVGCGGSGGTAGTGGKSGSGDASGGHGGALAGGSTGQTGGSGTGGTGQPGGHGGGGNGAGGGGGTGGVGGGTDGGGSGGGSGGGGGTGGSSECASAVAQGVCTHEGAICNNGCTDICQFCNSLLCVRGHWQAQEAIPAPCFACGPSARCQTSAAYCYAMMGGPVGAKPSYQCLPVPADCRPIPTCDCLKTHATTIGSDCQMAGAGEITATLNAP